MQYQDTMRQFVNFGRQAHSNESTWGLEMGRRRRIVTSVGFVDSVSFAAVILFAFFRLYAVRVTEVFLLGKS